VMLFLPQIRNSKSFASSIICAVVFLLSFSAPSFCEATRATRVAVLDFGNTSTGVRAAAKIRETLRAQVTDTGGEFEIIDPDQARAAASGSGFNGSLNMTLPEARDLGAAIGCDFFIVGDAQTVL